MQNIETAILLMVVGMPTVFVILLIVIYLGKLLITLVNKLSLIHIWWLGITYFVNKVRTKFNLRGIWILNRVVGSIVMLVSVAGLIYTCLLYTSRCV